MPYIQPNFVSLILCWLGTGYTFLAEFLLTIRISWESDGQKPELGGMSCTAPAPALALALDHALDRVLDIVFALALDNTNVFRLGPVYFWMGHVFFCGWVLFAVGWVLFIIWLGHKTNTINTCSFTTLSIEHNIKAATDTKIQY